MLVSGKRDPLWPASSMSERIVSRLADQKFEHHYEHIEYNSGHSGIIMNKNCWRNIFEFLEKHFN
jgi:homoserine acetyltransferase